MPGQITPDAVAQRPSNGTGPRQTGQTAHIGSCLPFAVLSRPPLTLRSLKCRVSNERARYLLTPSAGCNRRTVSASDVHVRSRRGTHGDGWRLSTVAGVKTSRHADIGRTYHWIACVEGKRLLTSRLAWLLQQVVVRALSGPSPSTERLGLSHPHESYTSCGQLCGARCRERPASRLSRALLHPTHRTVCVMQDRAG